MKEFQDKIKKLEENSQNSSSLERGNSSLSEIEAKLRDHDYQIKGLNNLINELKIHIEGFDSKFKLFENMKDSDGESNNLSGTL